MTHDKAHRFAHVLAQECDCGETILIDAPNPRAIRPLEAALQEEGFEVEIDWKDRKVKCRKAETAA